MDRYPVGSLVVGKLIKYTDGTTAEVEVWGDAGLKPPVQKPSSVMMWLSFLCGSVITATIIGFIFL